MTSTTHTCTDARSTDAGLSLVERYEREGFVIVRNVIDAQLLEEIRRHIFWLHNKHPTVRPEELGHLLVKDEPFFLRVATDDRLLDLAEQFIGPDIALFATGYLCKQPRTGRQVLWHQDGSYWPLDPVRVVSLWLAVSDATPANGCMRVIPRTHTLPLQSMQPREDVANVLGSAIDMSLVDESKAVDLVLQPGDVAIHHPNIIHGSGPNLSDDWRLTQLFRYIPTATRITQNPWPCAFKMRGQTIAGVNDYLPYPKFVEGRHTPFRGSERWT